jgi:hypothetical protein
MREKCLHLIYQPTQSVSVEESDVICFKATAKSRWYVKNCSSKKKERETINDVLIDVVMRMSFLSNIMHTLLARVSE